MLRDNGQIKLSLSPYQGLYDIIVPEDNLLRRIKENIDFCFVNPMLRKQYCENFGRPAKEPEMMFKLMFLKKVYDLSDEKLISSAQTDMAYKYFLDLEPEAEMINPSLLTKFRKTRITEDILEEMLRETIRQAIRKGLIKSTAIIVDSTHTTANARPKTVTQVLRDLSKQLRREIYREMIDVSEKFPEKPSETAELADEIQYTYQLLENVGDDILQSEKASLIELYEHIKELLDTDRIREIRSKVDEDAHFGHKTATSTFFGFKSHLAMTEERLITGIEVTHGGEPDCAHFPALLEKSIDNGIVVTEAIGDMAYVSEDNLDICEEKDVTLYARTNSAVAAAASAPLDEGFFFNKDAGLLQCPAGELAMRVDKRAAENGNTYLRYLFSKVKCKKCPLREQCRIGKSKSKEPGYSVTQPSEKNRVRLEFEDSEPFRERMKIRHRIEEKNGEMKVAHGLGRADSVGLAAMRLQMYFTAFAVNVKRIVKLIEPIPALKCTPNVRQYDILKTNGVIFMPKGIPHKRYTAEFKQHVIETMREEGLSYSETARQFDVNSHHRIQSWERIYLTEGAEGFRLERRGRGSTGRPAKVPKAVEEDLLAEVQRLRAENDYLKNLQALVLEDERRQHKKRW